MAIHLLDEQVLVQGSDEWKELRKGLITGTDAYKLLQGESIESILQAKAKNTFRGNYYTKRGHILEEEMKGIYSEAFEPITNVGFVTNDKYPLAGYSPDGLVGEDGLIECKAFNEKRHLSVAKYGDAAIIAQIQFGLFITERKWAKLLLYNPDIADIEKSFIIVDYKPMRPLFEKFAKKLEKVVDTKSIRG